MLAFTGLWRRSVDVGPSRLKFSVTEIVEMGSNGDIEIAKCHLQFLYDRFRIGLDSPPKFVVVDEEWSFIALVVSDARISCHETVEPAVDCLKESSALTTCISNVSSRSAHVVVLVPLVVNDCLKLGFTYHGW